MKKVLIGLIAAAMLLGSFAKAEEVDDIMMMNTEGKIEAAMAENKFYANLDTINASIAHLNKVQDSLQNVDDTRGVLSAIGQEVTVASATLERIVQDHDDQGAKELKNHLVKFSKQVDQIIKAQGL
ncbi:hypothetical protein [Bdellovibrio sp. NC01]|uniref:hypothetical protein n=1 Tax=Bdellovibrio sp. NC01 TaxID=2220073 RepID=UPI001159271B|nr:hypothetical protein [Bdellovibrio sp. NC01]QDK36509.1 hypothetical protein DOE51_02300 [Bdellovibrio sp. NC01]